MSAILKIWHCGSNFTLVYAIVQENPRMDIRESWRNCPWQYFRSFDRGIIILSVFMAPDRVVLMHRGTSHIGSCWHVFSERAGLSFREHKRRNGEICPCSCSASKAMFYWPLDPDRVISNHRDSSHVGSCQLTVCWVDFADSNTIIFHRC